MKIPHNKQIEKLVLGTIIGERGKLDEVREILTQDCFFVPEHGKIYEACCRVSDRGNRPDLMTVYQELGGSVEMLTLTDILGNSTFDVYQHAAILADLARRRALISIGLYLKSSGEDESLQTEEIMAEVEGRLSTLYMSGGDNIRTIDDVIGEVIEQVNANAKGDAPLLGYPTGFSKFDSRAGGLQPSDLIIIAGETSQGKTALALSMVVNAVKAGAGVGIFSLEMRNTQLVSRMLSPESGIPSTAIMYGRLNERQLTMLDTGIGKLSGKRVFFDERSSSNIDTIISSIRTLKKRHNIDGAVIDYLQILNVNMKGANAEQQMGDVARRLKNLAKDLDIWIIALSQLNRDQQSPEPTMNRLRASGQIAEAADIVCLVYRPEEYGRRYSGEFADKETKGTAMLHFAKGRNIGTMKFMCGFDGATTRFYELDDIPSCPTDQTNELPY
jgi:replicative DNA helicase